MGLSKKSKEALNKALEKSANVLVEAIDASGKIVKDNAKELVTEIIIYEGYIDGVFRIIGSLVLMALVTIAFNYKPSDEYYSFVAEFFGIIGGVISVFRFISSIQHIVKVKFAPRLFLVSYAASLLKSDDETKKSV